MLTTESDQEERWDGHLREVLNRHSPEETADILEAAEDLDITIKTPRREEIVAAIKTLKASMH